jgi:hypothetical protein
VHVVHAELWQVEQRLGNDFSVSNYNTRIYLVLFKFGKKCMVKFFWLKYGNVVCKCPFFCSGRGEDVLSPDLRSGIVTTTFGVYPEATISSKMVVVSSGVPKNAIERLFFDILLLSFWFFWRHVFDIFCMVVE